MNDFGARALILLCGALFFAGCGTVPRVSLPVLHGENDTLAATFHARAVESEKRGEWQRALAYWKVVLALNPDDRATAAKITGIEATSQQRAENHFRLGLAYYKKDLLEAARREFLTALRYDPEQKAALNYLKNIATIQASTIYRVQEGDTFEKIAKKFYRDPAKDFLVAYFNNLDTSRPLSPGTVLQLPLLDEDLSSPLVDIEKELELARQLFLNKDYPKVLPITAKVLQYDRSNAEAVQLNNAANFQWAQSLQSRKKYVESLKLYKKLDPAYKGVMAAMAEVTHILKNQAEQNYRIGVEFFLKEELDKAIEYWQKTHELYPAHPKAKNDIANARRLLEKLKEVE
ncbi:MAG: LysM peptidoglycan-binding domain-containing protein [Desulfobacterales bacterium]|nr:MAG: LysM peptidoglycan-binding domain-containing protein [Desulfobacterales bacterium]